MSWDTSSIEAMENTCREETEGNCNKKVYGLWLEVILYAGQGPIDEHYEYLYNEKRISRERASAILEEGKVK